MTTQEWRRKLKAAHLCRDCKKQDAYTLSGRTRCAECAEREAEAQRKRRKEKNILFSRSKQMTKIWTHFCSLLVVTVVSRSR